ncbi:MAG: tRNA (guanosine(46)-N7)-methyltransferase TrmB [Verrucomicrobia bacterium]|nr:tRNA (guanosine(46)-N7)-methyltransferase TrmB [Verrucomicrobiota bacterium]MCG2681054.1 tRNA (guanosine(46)-N7)-methyltransferase TrmB [Kiritimatiellia bacterium]MBU4248038.1 tRNA (guanosine(46)-N7)-methyltransferase TrmB [Verrucomicrobiota bacterium]MBU4291978.1 tRNA (guanosine(46)-N7)-methyltransferase TrmB [Verrucomicrobiota bacterium]MBU4430271.1 tRNA (guanosine(46)-N7)-methyltransferase TrmB [Verrucomicrobiota bacterium]
MCASPDSLRVIPSNWLGPLSLESMFGCKPRALEVDLGCGKGRFLLAHAARHPEVSFLGIDCLLLRILAVEREARRRQLSNIRLVYVEACYAISYLLPARSVTTFYIFFPDPWPKRRHHRRRLFDEGFLNGLDRTLIPGGAIHIATDHEDYLEAIRKVFSSDGRFDPGPPLKLDARERTDFELQFLNKRLPIGRCSFRNV